MVNDTHMPGKMPSVSRTYREAKHKEYLDKEKERELKKETKGLGDGVRRINGRLYSKYNEYTSKADAQASKDKLREEGKFTHLDKKFDKWIVYYIK